MPRRSRHRPARGRTNYDRDEVTRFAAQMVIVRLSAVAQRLGSQAPVAIPDFDWTGLTGTRNRIVHEYPTIDYEIVWNALEHEVAELAAALDRIRQSEA
ncbi:MAG: HepT-like ribonuclease domain-containing protein [Pseudonocardiaceae bacterium]